MTIVSKVRDVNIIFETTRKMIVFFKKLREVGEIYPRLKVDQFRLIFLWSTIHFDDFKSVSCHT